MSDRFTQGPWRVSSIANGFEVEARINAQWEVIAQAQQCRPIPDDRTQVERCANARLIAAAPDLLAACKAQHDAIDRLLAILVGLDPNFFPSRSGQPWAALDQGNTAIAKATGEQP